jgi:hypothetical protein
MKFRFFTLVFALSLAVWAQEGPSTSAPNATPKPETKSCCHHGSDAKGSMSCCHQANEDTKDAASSHDTKCEAKDGKSCCAGKEMADAKCCAGKDMKKCMKQCKKNDGCADGKCCSGEKSSAMSCCGARCEHSPQTTSASL